DYRDPGELVAALKQKEEEVVLAAQLGNALLLENQQLKDQSDKLHEQYADKLEELEQGKHELRLKLEGCQSQWESQVSDLEKDARELSARVERLTGALAQAERDKGRAQRERDEQTQRLREQLQAAVEVERAMSNELQALKQELQQKGSHNRLQDEELISAMREQVLRLTQKEQVLGERLESACEENSELRANLASLHARLARHDQLNQQHAQQQLAQARQEAEVAESRAQQLREQVEDLQEKVAAQAAGNHGDVSLLSELEASLEAADLGVSEEESAKLNFSIWAAGGVWRVLAGKLTYSEAVSSQAPYTHSPPSRSHCKAVRIYPHTRLLCCSTQMKQEMGSILQLLLPLARDPSSSEGSEGADQRGDLQIMLQQLKGVAETLTQTARAQKNGSKEMESCTIKNILLQQENTELRNHLVSAQEKAGIVHQAIRDRDEAISKKNLMEVELVRSKNDMMSLNNQLLEAIQRKLELSQELEAWQDDIQIILNQQLRSQQQSELPQ
uniref:Si:ch211-235m3.5 n=1 Tax=Tetraodon nigroviridis TaxID=99883 RepID=H3DPN1_TETNG